MNPFVNPNKRSITLPAGCKDLVDVLNQKENEKNPDDEVIRRFIHVILFQAQRDKATAVVIGKPSADGETPIRYKVGKEWHTMPSFPSEIRRNLIKELLRMANFAAGYGAFDFRSGGSKSRWVVSMMGPGEECRLVCEPD